MQTFMQTSICACEKQMCGGITVNCCRHWTLSDKVLRFNRRATVKRTWLFECDYCGQTGPHAKARCVVLTLKCLPGGGITCRLLPESSWNCLQHFLIITWREYIISRAISPVVGDQGRPRILFFLLSCPLCCRHSLWCVWVTPTLTVIWALNIVLAFNTFQKWLMFFTFCQ